jgi:enamine deaminase RidA (YjgF/YER057c/UK114 family)
MIALHQVPSELFNAGQTSWSKGLKEQMDDFRQRVRTAASTISSILEEIGNLGMLLYLPVAA